MKDAIGGYLNLEFSGVSQEYYTDFLRFNSARSALSFLVKTKRYTKVYVPFYTCGVVLDELEKINVALEFYSINERFELNEIPQIKEKECFLYTNYFGLKDEYILHLAKVVPSLVIDNAQAFFAKALKDVDTIYSPRKFFGLPDGGYLATDIPTNEGIEKDTSSYDRFIHLIKRVDLGAEESFLEFKANDQKLELEGVKRMSLLTEKMLSHTIDYNYTKSRRYENFIYLHKHLKEVNQLDLPSLSDEAIPLAYPFIAKDKALRERLLNSRVYVPKYWPDVLDRVKKDSKEYFYVNNIIPLPIDQRYGIDEMKVVLREIKRGQ